MARIKKYVKRPLEIEALQFDGHNMHQVINWIDSIEICVGINGELFINTLEGRMEVSVADYVIKGVKGEFYPCKPDVFSMTYEEVVEFERDVDEDGNCNVCGYPMGPHNYCSVDHRKVKRADK